MFERNSIADLEKWAVKPNRKPLILRGTRQVGKTTLVDSFSQKWAKRFAHWKKLLFWNFAIRLPIALCQ